MLWRSRWRRQSRQNSDVAVARTAYVSCTSALRAFEMLLSATELLAQPTVGGGRLLRALSSNERPRRAWPQFPEVWISLAPKPAWPRTQSPSDTMGAESSLASVSRGMDRGGVGAASDALQRWFPPDPASGGGRLHEDEVRGGSNRAAVHPLPIPEVDYGPSDLS